MIANPQATTHEPTRCPVKFNRPKYAGRVCLMKRPVFRSLKSRRMAARRGFRLGHDGLSLAFGSLCARLAAFHFEVKAEMNADDPCESPAERPSGPSEPRTLPNKDKTKHSAAAAQHRAGARLGLLVGRRRSNLILIFTRNAARRAHSERSER